MTPRSPKSPARKKARVWKWYGLFKPVDQDEPVYVGDSRDDVGLTMRDWGGAEEDYEVRPVEIREILPAPVPPRSRKGGSRG